MAGAKADSANANATGAKPCPTVTPTLVIDNPRTLVVPRDYQGSIPKYKLQAQRLAVRLGVDRTFDGNGILSAQAEGDRFKVFTSKLGGDEQPSEFAAWAAR